MEGHGDRRRQVPLGSVLIANLAIVVGCGEQSRFSELPIVNGETRAFTFAADDAGRIPAGWKVDQTGEGQGSCWAVVEDSSAPSGGGVALAQLAASPRSVFNLCIIDEVRYADLSVRVDIKAIEGDVDQGGGVAWRLVDANNYYVCRFNPLEDNLRIYKVVTGRRRELASVDVKLPAGQWHTLTAAMKGDRIVCEVGSAQLVVRDDALPNAGRVGLWTKADARTHFTSLQVTGIQSNGSQEP